MNKAISYRIIAVALIFSMLILSACTSGETNTKIPIVNASQKGDILGKWNFEPIDNNWQYEWMEFFEDGTYMDNGFNSRTYTLLSDGRLKLTANVGGRVFLFDVSIEGDKMQITDEEGNRAIGTRER